MGTPGRPKRKNTRENFKRWLATPSHEREPPTQKEFAKVHNVNAAQLSQWKNEKEFMDDVEQIRRKFLDEHLSEVYNVAKEKALEGDPRMIEFIVKQAGRERAEKKEVTYDEKKQEMRETSNDKLADLMTDIVVNTDAIKGSKIDKDNLKSELRSKLGDY